MAQELVQLGVQVTVVTGSPCRETEELNEGYRIKRSDSMLTLFREASLADCVVIRGDVSAAAGLMGILLRRPMICFHEMANVLRPPRDHIPWRPLAAAASAVRVRVMRKARLHVGVSHAVLASKKGLPYGARTGVLYNPVADFLWPKKITPLSMRDLDISFVGRVREDKGVFVLAAALERLDRYETRIRVGIVGDGPDLTRVKRRVAHLHSIKVSFFHSQRDAALSALYARTRWLLVPSTTHPEGMGMVVAEALAHGTPVIVADQAPLLEVAGAAGIDYPRLDASALAATLGEALDGAVSWEEKSRKARVERERFCLSNYKATLKRWLDQGYFSNTYVGPGAA